MSREYSRKKVRKQIKISEEAHANLVKLTQISKLDMGIVTGYLAELALKYDLFSVGWEDRMKVNLIRVEAAEYMTAENKCIKLSWDETDWLCVTYRRNRAPIVKKLGKTIQKMNGRCTFCKTQRWVEADEVHERNVSWIPMRIRNGTMRGIEEDWETWKVSLLERGSPEEMLKIYEEEREKVMSWFGLPL